MNYEELYNKIHKELFATLWELQNTNPTHELKVFLQTKLEVCYNLIGDTLDDDWHKQIEKALE